MIASKKIKTAFKKLLILYRNWKERKEMEALLRIVNDFDKVEGYEKWLDSQVPKNGLDVV